MFYKTRERRMSSADKTEPNSSPFRESSKIAFEIAMSSRSPCFQSSVVSLLIDYPHAITFLPVMKFLSFFLCCSCTCFFLCFFFPPLLHDHPILWMSAHHCHFWMLHPKIDSWEKFWFYLLHFSLSGLQMLEHAREPVLKNTLNVCVCVLCI